MLVLAIIGAGGVFTGTNPAYTAHELAHHLKTSKSCLMLTEPEILSNILQAAKACNLSEKNILIFNPMNQAIPRGFRSWESLLQYGEQDWVRFDDEQESRTTTAGRFFSSGTTGLPKAAVISHYNFVAQHTLAYEMNEPKPYDVSFSLYIQPPILRCADSQTPCPPRVSYGSCTINPHCAVPQRPRFLCDAALRARALSRKCGEIQDHRIVDRTTTGHIHHHVSAVKSFLAQ